MCYWKIFICILILANFLFSANNDSLNQEEAIIFEDNFDGNGYAEGWKPTKFMATYYPYKLKSGGTGNLKNYEPSGFPPEKRTNKNSWNGWKGIKDAIEVAVGEGRNNSNCLKINYPPGIFPQIGLIKWLGPKGYKELYISWSFKFSDNWRWGKGKDYSFYFKLIRIYQGVDLNSMPKTTTQNTWTMEFPYYTVLNIQDDATGTFSPYFYAKFRAGGTIPAPECPSNGLGPVCNILNWWEEKNKSGHLATYTGAIDDKGYFTQLQKWHSVKYHIRLRDNIKTENAIFEIWVDGKKLSASSPRFGFPVPNPFISAEGGGMNFINLADNGSLGKYWTEKSSLYIDDFVISTQDTGTGIDQKMGLAPSVEKNNAFFSKKVRFQFESSTKEIKIYNLLGDLIKVISVNKSRATWNGINNHGVFKPGVYIAKVFMENKTSAFKFFLAR